jgi:hypothetical protein
MIVAREKDERGSGRRAFEGMKEMLRVRERGRRTWEEE